MVMRKRVWCISKYASPPNYGVGAKLHRTAKYLSEVGFDVTLVSSDANHLAKYPASKKVYQKEHDGTLVHWWIRTLKYTRSASFGRILSWLDFERKLFSLRLWDVSGKPDLVIVSSLSILTVLYGIYVKHRFRCKLVFEVRDLYPLTLTEEFGFSKFHPLVLLLSAVERAGYRQADLVVGTMPNLKEQVKEVVGYEKEVFFSPIGIPSIWDLPITESPRVDVLFAGIEGKFVIGYAGSMGTSNALEPLMLTMERMAVHDHLRFVLVGGGDSKATYQARFLGAKNVQIGPKLEQHEVPYFLSKCDLLYLSTSKSRVWDYGQSMNKVVDYMMAGKPVVATYFGYPSMLNEANSGIFVSDTPEEIRDAILSFANMTEDERKVYGARGRDWVLKNNSYAKIGADYHQRLVELLSK